MLCTYIKFHCPASFTDRSQKKISPMCLASVLQFYHPSFWQMPAIRTMWSLTIWLPFLIDTETKQSMRNCQTCCQCVSQTVPGALREHWTVACLSKSPHHSACGAYVGWLVLSNSCTHAEFLRFLRFLLTHSYTSCTNCI